MIDIVIADDHAVVRTGIQLIFNGNTKYRIKAEARNGEELIKLLNKEEFQVAIIDMNMPGKDSLDLIHDILDRYPKLHVLVFTMNSDEQLAKRLFKKGILAYISKEENPDELLNALAFVSQGKKYLTPAQKNIFANQFLTEDDHKKPHEKLTDREYQIMCLLASGIPKNDIAQKLNISKNTLSNHRDHILKKLEISNSAELTKYALKHHLII